MTTLYGIPNCSTVKKARTWLDAQSILYTFVDFKKQAPTAELIQSWLQDVPLTTLINKRGTTWRKLSPEEQASAEHADAAIALMITNPSIIKRPVLVHAEHTQVGFSEDAYADTFQKAGA
ncbi:MAG: arsenate reductase [Neisseriaceae bacterium]|nr:arsenate reductase [Neisseriaceae bacterium]MBP6861279.1 arsenate reductase [Neisseriaceae bacterium]